jgi:hypothetical protein
VVGCTKKGRPIADMRFLNEVGVLGDLAQSPTDQ